jgi:hypothetical protein
MKKIEGMSPIFNGYWGIFPPAVKLTIHLDPVM